MADLLLADLHLPVSRPGASSFNEAFLRFCAGPARQAQRVFVLGDLFETWIGDDLGLADYSCEVAALKALSDSGVAVFYQTGNRDFLLGAAFARASGAKQLRDEHVTTLAGMSTLLAHGDQYCTDDAGYQRWRRFSHHRLAQAVFMQLPARLRRRIADRLRQGSASAKQAKPAEIMDVHPQAIAAALARHGVTRMIHGHTHRPAEHSLAIDGKHGERWVLADWRADRMEWLEVSTAGWLRKTF